ncbi:HupE/UreJ family protein [Sphaerothrix gracilis]|uniref:HupE/UreJ family protein n=1 Tax=Sphaerothrix gracilis TaxID=3151835 RepID=UPI0031FBB012
MTQFRFLRAFPRAIAPASRLALVMIAGLLLAAPPVLAHHPFGGSTPDNIVQGFLSGMGHPVIGLDHLAFVITAGLMAVAVGRGLMVPVSFVLASLLGTGLHLMGLNLPAPEFVISASVLAFGALLAMKSQPHTGIVAGLALLAGIFHGYAYGEAVVGAEMMPLAAYLLGFATVQMAIALLAYGMADRLTGSRGKSLGLRFAGFALAGVGAAFLSGVVLG